jgi:hypothetical protein
MADPALIYRDYRQTGVLDMLSNKFGGIAGAAMLGTAALLGTNAANAIGYADGKVTEVVMYAEETLAKQTNTDDLDGYYTLTEDNSDDQHNVTLGGLSFKNGDEFSLSVTLTNMKIAENLTELSVVQLDNSNASETRMLHGMTGDEMALLTFSAGSPSQTGENRSTLTVDLGALAIAQGADSGSIMLTLTNKDTEDSFGAGTGTKEQNYASAIRIVTGLMEDFKGPEGNPEAAVSTGFTEFNSSGSTTVAYASLGTMGLSVKADVRNAGSGSDTVEITDLIASDATAADSSSFVVSGDFSFMSLVWLQVMDGSNDTCATAGVADDDIRKMNDDEEYEMDSAAQNANLFAAAAVQILCIHVPGEDADEPMAIQPGSYTVTPSYKASADTQARTPTGDTHDLGSITRDGTTVRFPYLTTREDYVQRIRIVSRAADGATYTMTFADNAEAMALASDTLDKGRTTLMVSDLVTINDGTTTSGTLIIEAQRGMIDVATTLNTPGSTDTVLH